MNISELYKFQIITNGIVYNLTLNNRYCNFNENTSIAYDRQNKIIKKRTINKFIAKAYYENIEKL